MAKKKLTEHWHAEPEAHDYPAAADFLSLLLAPDRAAAAVKALQGADVVHRKAKDLLRASGLPVLSSENAEVRKDLEKVRLGAKLSPVLVVRGDLERGYPTVLADGYHRVCASYHIDEDADVPCQIADLGSTS